MAADLPEERPLISPRILDGTISGRWSEAKEAVDAGEREGALLAVRIVAGLPGLHARRSSAGPIKKQFALYCDIIDEAGGIATIATILASNHINIKNIGIIHNREFEEGALRIEFYDGSRPARKRSELLQKFHYIVYET